VEQCCSSRRGCEPCVSEKQIGDMWELYKDKGSTHTALPKLTHPEMILSNRTLAIKGAW